MTGTRSDMSRRKRDEIRPKLHSGPRRATARKLGMSLGDLAPKRKEAGRRANGGRAVLQQTGEVARLMENFRNGISAV
jgi:hypothetical protein